MSDQQLTFVGYRRPALAHADYAITVEQRIDLDQTPFTATRTFTVAGDRFALPPTAVRSVFPPDGSMGDHSNVLPHIVLDRPTLPWERSPGAGSDAPWLALLLFTDAERPQLTSVTRADLALESSPMPAPTAETGEPPDEQVSVIDVPYELLATLLPTLADLPYTAHVRRGEGQDAAVLIGGRLPPPGQSATVHLVSLEERYDASGAFHGRGTVRLVSLYSWRFSCTSARHSFGILAGDLGTRSGPLRLADTGDTGADACLRQGLVPVRHALQDGGRTVSWYRGPFATGPVPGAQVTPLRSADRVLRYHADTGLFDLSYAAAWQLGRLLALRSGVATSLYEWKRRRNQARRRTVPDGFPLAVTGIDDGCPADVAAFLADLALLRGVPFAYLLPDERLLPKESVRFFTLDQLWVRYLVDGAFSIGRLGASDAAQDAAHPPPTPFPQTTGALIRSELVSGYPDLLVDAYPAGGTAGPLPLARRDTLAPDLMLLLFEGTVRRLDLHQRPETLHFAVEQEPDGQYSKTLRGEPARALAAADFGVNRTLALSGLAGRIAAELGTPAEQFGSGDFARQMIETAERVTFLAAGTAVS
jgi:hypothetical protein